MSKGWAKCMLHWSSGMTFPTRPRRPVIMATDLKFGGLSVAYDSGPRDAEKILLILHGFNFHSGIFTLLLPLAQANGCRVLLINRRGYPGAAPYSEADWDLIRRSQDESTGGAEAMTAFMQHRAGEVHAFLVEFISTANPPVKQNSIIIAGWSFTSAWIISLLANASQYPTCGIDVPFYIRRAVTYDATYYTLGMDYSPITYNPLKDEVVPLQDRARNFLLWVSGYFNHPDIFGLVFEERTPLASPRPTLTKLSPEQIASFSNIAAVTPDGQDTMILKPALMHDSLRKNVRLALAGQAWGSVEWRYIWCDMSACDMPCGIVGIRDAMAKADAEGGLGRKVGLTRWRGANHFAHWDNPEKTLVGLLADDPADVDFTYS